MQHVAVILAAGLGTRMKSKLPKVLHRIAGVPMLSHLVRAAEPKFDRIVVVTGPDMKTVAEAAAPHEVIVQHERRGTADAARAAAGRFGDGVVTIIYGDNALVTGATLGRLRARLADGDAAMALLGTRPPEPGAYGRIVGDPGFATRIVEYAEATEAERAIPLCNVGGFSARADNLRRWLGKIGDANAKGEFYLTDLVAVAHAEGARVAVIEAPWDECRGVNSRAELAAAEATMQARLRATALAAGVTMTAPETVFCSADTAFAPDVVVEPHVVFGPGVLIEEGATIRAFSHLEGCTIGPGAIIGPYARIRPGSIVGDGAHVGNFVELKAARLGAGVKANHLTYLGDTEIGARSNIGAGTITCNYDGYAKHRTTIGADVFVGSDVALVAPVSVGDGAIIGAGSVITENVEADALAIARGRQVTKSGRAATIRLTKGKH
ncbi:bifunctional UDP-N-acetylglucosamine diphosphorylase/glucosamine-1-phosphate N-acetyltransferase GlmU [Acidiphilium iwatense]|uniref:Bifunctional protein GlmU n=1 Tax=Acidiphilium iwatense TaxID=768198 RepID=A0ABS9DZ78_9PROT|nr:bifunctional UDP-N-acetylglucosamine diphosphorylase/glucosamine-1-phosphate N-acetyltransferase GlmU [Acidiphilium iwatense]MCF3946737.1 bifunctional UDP-N-acetylglucosamine diphosphorylase/glucosamine-1-phosphate N-acetyltransferase GlmU [Acidiphilium iwatense]